MSCTDCTAICCNFYLYFYQKYVFFIYIFYIYIYKQNYLVFKFINTNVWDSIVKIHIELITR